MYVIERIALVFSGTVALCIPPDSMRTRFPELKTTRPELMRRDRAFGALAVLTNPSAINSGLPTVPHQPEAVLYVPRDDGDEEMDG